MKARRTGTTLASLALVGVALVGCDTDDADDDRGDVPGTSTSRPDDGGGSGAPGVADRDLATESVAVSVDEAMSAALQEAGDGTVTQIGLDFSDDSSAWVYDVDVRSGDTQHEVSIDAETGEVREFSQDTEGDKPKQVDPTKLTPEEAMKKALAVQDGTVSGWSLDWDDGAQRYDVDIRSGNDDTEVVVDVDSGEARRG